MNYISTRDKSKKQYSFTDILLKGLAEDGGLFVPEETPFFDKDELETLSKLPYHELAFNILHPFTGDSIPEADLKDILEKTYTEEIFGTKAIAPVEKSLDSLYIQDLSSGPSLAFKDMAMQLLGNLMEYELNRQDRKLTILGASSGDTVSAAEEAMKGKSRIKVVMLTPKEGMSEFQKAQAGSILDENIYNLSIPGPFDICQDIVKEINRDLEFKNTYNIGAVNSINWGRICAQIVYYFKGYFQVNEYVGDPLDVVVPSGNFGNILAGYYAKKMGLPIRKLIIATNENIVLDTFFKTGIYRQKDVVVTSSPSMDISKASNIERLFFDLVNHDAEKLAKLMKTFETTKEINLEEHLDQLTSIGFDSGQSSHEQRQNVIKHVFDKTNRVIDPHTAAGIKVALDKKNEFNIPMMCLETAKPTKFESAIQDALDFIPERPVQFKDIEKKPHRFFDCPAQSVSIQAFIKTI